MKKIIVPIDFSAAADNALKYAVKFAEWHGASILLLHAYRPPRCRDDNREELCEEELREINSKVLQRLEQRIQSNFPAIKIELYMQPNGLDVDVIEKVAEERKAYMIVLGISESGLLEENFFGSRTMDIIRNSATPVLIVPAGYTYCHPGRIVFASDCSELKNDQPLSALVDLVSSFRAHLSIVNVRPDNKEVPVKKTAALLHLKKLLKRVKYSLHCPVHENVVEGINSFARESGAGIVAMIPHRHNIFYRLFNLSCTLKMAFHSEVPLLVLPEGKSVPVMVKEASSKVREESVFLSEKISEEEIELFNKLSSVH